MSKSDDRQVERLVINRMTRKTYNELSAQPGKLSDYELYLVDDDVVDTFNKRIVNVAIPVDQNDAINKTYADNTYVKSDILKPEVLDYSKIYSKVSEKHQNGDTYIEGTLDVYEKNTSTIHATEIISGDFQPSDVTISWTTEHGGIWIVNYPGVTERDKWTGQMDPLVDSFIYESEDKSVQFKVSSWKKIGKLAKESEYVKKSDVKNIFKNITTESDLPSVINAIIELKNL